MLRAVTRGCRLPAAPLELPHALLAVARYQRPIAGTPALSMRLTHAVRPFASVAISWVQSPHMPVSVSSGTMRPQYLQ